MVGPIIVQPNEKFDGNDGEWSTFSIKVGTQRQEVRLLPSTKISETWIVATDGCSTEDTSTCPGDRGGLFDYSQSDTWKSYKNDPKSFYALIAEANLGYIADNNRARVGYDTIALSTPTGGKVIDNQLLAGIAAKQFFLGNLGLSARDSLFNNTQPSLLTALYNNKQIPSRSYGYTAGAFYKKATFGSLTLGGYDRTRFVPTEVTSQFAPTDDKDLTIGLESITFSNNNKNKTLLSASEGTYFFVDSTVPDIWLPDDVCKAFADAYGLKFDDARAKYTIDDTNHQKNLQSNPTASFVLKGSLNSDKSVTINIPYKAFDLKFTTTGTKPSTFNYFPIRQAHTANQYTLGRTFLQEAYLIVDYERKNFTIAQALQASDAEPDLVPILSLTADSADPSQPTPSGAIFQTPAGVPTGAIAGIVVAAVVIIAAILGFFCWRRKKRSRGAHTPIPQPVVESPYPPHPIPPYSELANHKSPNGQDYFALQPNAYHGGHTKGAPSLAVSETSELYSPPLGAHGFNPQEQVIPERSELPASDSGPAAELHSEPHSRNPSNVSTPSAFPVGGRFSNGGSPPDMTHGGRAGASPEPWASGTHYDPSSPHPSLMSAQSIPIQYHPGSSANLVSHSAGARDIRRGGSTRSGTSTLVEEPHSDVGPSTGSPEISHSAFQSPYIGAHAQRNNQERYRDVITPEPLDENQATTYFDSTRR